MRLRVLLIMIACFSLCVYGKNENTDKKFNVVVMNFSGNRTEEGLSVAVSEMLRGILTSIEQKDFRFVERAKLNDILKEQALSVSGAVDESQSQKIGKLLSADYMIVGSLSKLGSNYTITAQMINAATSEVTRSCNAVAPDEDRLSEEIHDLALVIIGKEKADKKINRKKKTRPAKKMPPTRYEYSSWYSDATGKYTGGTITIEVRGSEVTGTSMESYGSASINGQVSGTRIVGYYKGAYGYGNFEFDVGEEWKKLNGTYYQVSNGAGGKWCGELRKSRKIKR